MKFLTLAATLTISILGLIIGVEFLAGLYPSVLASLTTLNATGNATSGEHLIPLRAILAPDGVIPLVIVAVFVIGVVVGLFALIKSKKSSR